MKKKILFINIFGGQGGGGEVYLKRLIQALGKNNDSVLLSPKCKALDFDQNEDIQIIQIDEIRKNKSFFNILIFFKLIFQINYQILRIKPCKIIINGDRAIYLAPFLFLKNRIIGVKHMLIDSRIKGFLVNLVLKNSFKLVTISNFHKTNFTSYIKQSYLNKIVVIYNSVDVDSFLYKPIQDFSRIKFIQISSLEKRKGIFDTLNSFKHLTETYQNVELSLVGSGEQIKLITNFVEDNNLHSKIFVLGQRNDIKELLENHHILLLPSYDEGLPLSILEAFSVGRPAISTRIAGIPELIDNHLNGFLVDAGDSNSLVEKMLWFCENPTTINKMGYNGRSKVESGFSQTDWTESWISLIN